MLLAFFINYRKKIKDNYFNKNSKYFITSKNYKKNKK